MALPHSFSLQTFVLSSLPANTIVVFLLFILTKYIYRLTFHPLRKIPGPWIPATTSLWIRWNRWHGRMSLTADKLFPEYGSMVRITPNMILVNDAEALSTAFLKQDFDTAPKAIRALRVGDNRDWIMTMPELETVKPLRYPVMLACTTKHLRYWQRHFEENQDKLFRKFKDCETQAYDIVDELRLLTLDNGMYVLAGTGTECLGEYLYNFPRIMKEYNQLVIWRLCLPEWTFKWLRSSPIQWARNRVRSSEYLFQFGREIVRQAKIAQSKDEDLESEEKPPNVYRLLASGKKTILGDDDIAAEIAGILTAFIETTSSTLAFTFYELAKRPEVQDKLFEELSSSLGYENLDKLSYLDAVIKEGLRFRPPAALTGSRVIGGQGMLLMGHYLPPGTVITTQSLSITRQRPDIFPQWDSFIPERWLDPNGYEERRRLLLPFGIGTRRCPGINMAYFEMRLVIAGIIRNFMVKVAPETTPETMAPYEANGYWPKSDCCNLFFMSRD